MTLYVALYPSVFVDMLSMSRCSPYGSERKQPSYSLHDHEGNKEGLKGKEGRLRKEGRL